jgi:hypothetical protein
MVRINPKETTKPKRLSDKEMRKVLLSLKKRAEKSPEEADSLSIEVICSGKDIAKSHSPLRHKK